MNILDIANVQDCITSLDITARHDGRFLHEWIIGENAGHQLPHCMTRDILQGRISLHYLSINWHGTPNGRGQPEMGWAFNGEKIPKELLEAEITNLRMQCRNGVSFWVSADIEMVPLMAEMIINTFKEE